ncbi:hypothetical protein FYJ46_24120 [Enterobacteriaceae bacterium]|nr:hypothetical protein [Enterobacteriaceae bacterium]
MENEIFRPSDNHLAYFRTFPCVDVQNCTISDTKTAVVPPFWRFLKALWLKNRLNVVYFPNSKLTPSRTTEPPRFRQRLERNRKPSGENPRPPSL